MDVTPYLELKPAPVVLFDAAAERADDVRFMVEADGDRFEPVTWREFADLTAGCALWLTEHGVGRGDFAAIFADNSVQWLAAALGIQSAGAAMVPIYGNSTSDQVHYVLGHSEARVLFVQPGPKAATAAVALAGLTNPPVVIALPATDGAEHGFAHTWQTAAVAEIADHHADPSRLRALLDAIELDDHGVMLYTSGTSGRPKGVPLTHRNVGVNGRDWLQCNGPLVEERDVDLLWLPFSHIFGFGEACLGNTLGFVSYLCSPLTVLKHMPTVRPHIFMSVPAYVEKIATLAAGADSSAAGDDPAAVRAALDVITGGRLRFCLSGGAGLKREVKDLLYTHGILVIEGYGLTEAAPTLTLNRPDAFRFDTVGKPLPSVELRLADDGEIQARGDNVFAGYHKDPEATAAAFTDDGWLKTGDLGALTDDGFVRIIGRKKEILVTAGGKNIPPANIEIRFADDPLVDHVVVYGDGQRYLVAGVWLNPLVAFSKDLIDASGNVAESGRAVVQRRIDAVNAELPRYETIKRFVVFPGSLSVDNGLLTPTLKVRRNEVYKRYGAALDALYDDRVQPGARP